jgi:3-oxoadipate enol-lactonase
VTELVSTARGRFAVHAAGPRGGWPVVLVAGLGDDHASWGPILEYLTLAYRCITFDNRGIGASLITPGPYRIADLAADAHALHQALGLTPCVVIGSSMGGAIGQEWALRYPADVAGVVLSNTWGRTDAFLRVLFEHWISLAGKGSADQLLADVLPHAELRLLEAGHMTFWETPETWGSAVTEWLGAQAFG